MEKGQELPFGGRWFLGSRICQHEGCNYYYDLVSYYLYLLLALLLKLKNSPPAQVLQHSNVETFITFRSRWVRRSNLFVKINT